MLGTPSIQPGVAPGLPQGGPDRAAANGEGPVDAFALLLADAVAPGADAQAALPAAPGEQAAAAPGAAADAGLGASPADRPPAVDVELLAWLATLTEPLAAAIVAEHVVGSDVDDSRDDGEVDDEGADGEDSAAQGLATLLATPQAAPASIAAATHPSAQAANPKPPQGAMATAVASTRAHEAPARAPAGLTTVADDAHARSKGPAPLEVQRSSAAASSNGPDSAASALPPDLGAAGGMSPTPGTSGTSGATDAGRAAPPDPAGPARDANAAATPVMNEPQPPVAAMRPATQGRGAVETMHAVGPLPPAEPEERTEAPSPGPAWAAAQAPSPAGNRQAATPVASAAPAFAAQLSAAIDSPGFAPALGVQVAMLARNGIAEARLQIHPAEWGPIAVHIELDGRTAQVNLSAEHGFTRQALEQAMPALASALGDAGFTLTGGGVFQQPRESRPPAMPARQGARGAATPAQGLEAAAVAPSHARSQQGAVDLYA